MPPLRIPLNINHITPRPNAISAWYRLDYSKHGQSTTEARAINIKMNSINSHIMNYGLTKEVYSSTDGYTGNVLGTKGVPSTGTIYIYIVTEKKGPKWYWKIALLQTSLECAFGHLKRWYRSEGSAKTALFAPIFPFYTATQGQVKVMQYE